MEILLQQIINGLVLGSMYALVALGYTMVYGIINLINFAHGEVLMVGALTSWAIIVSMQESMPGMPGWIILIISMLISCVVAAALNFVIEKVAYRPLRGAPKLAPLITAVGFSFILQNVGLLWLGGQHRSVPDLIDSQDRFFTIGGVGITHGDILALVVTVPLVILLVGFINNSRSGRAMRATAQDPEAARLMGINVDTTIALTFLLGGLMAGAAGLVSVLYQTREWYFEGFRAGLFAFTAAVMGGIGNLKGAVVGGLIIGIIQQTAESRLEDGSAWAPAVVFAILVLVMVFRPQGLFGEETREG